MMLELFGFEEALKRLKEGKRVTRRGWNGEGQRVCLQTPDAHSKMTAPYIYIEKPDGARNPWVPSTGDLFADDWHEWYE